MNHKNPSDLIRKLVSLTQEHWDFLSEEAKKERRSRTFILRDLIDSKMKKKRLAGSAQSKSRSDKS